MTNNTIFFPPAPERRYPERTDGDHTSKWVNSAANGPVAPGLQPITETNPNGNMQPIPAMGITAEIAGRLEGPQPS